MAEEKQGKADQTKSRNKKTLWSLLMLVAGMVMLAYASVPLYQLFCRVTGFGGTPKISQTESATVGSRSFVVRFNTDVNSELPWLFQPEQANMTVQAGQTGLAFFKARNEGPQPITGVASYNVTPAKVAPYFNKVQCFCFTNQTLAPGESVDMPVSFFVDPEIARDPDLDDVNTITLSYTFFKAEEQKSSEE